MQIHRQAETPRDPQALARFDEWAATGERLDPNNSYFPAMRAVGLYAARRDKEATDALDRAANKPMWREYYAQEVEGAWKLSEAQYGETGTIARSAVAAAVLFPHYAQLRVMSRVATAQAVAMEQRGDHAEGLRIRKAVARVGAKMRADGQSIITNLVGIAITQIAEARPGGAAPIPSSGNGDGGKQRTAQIRKAYADYLTHIGQPDEAAWITQENINNDAARDAFKRSSELGLWSSDSLLKLVRAWGVGIALLASALWILAMGAFASVLARTRPVRLGDGSPGPVRAGLFSAVALLLVSVVTLGLASAFGQDDTLVPPAAMAGLTVLTAPLLWAIRGQERRGLAVGQFALTLLGAALFVGVTAAMAFGPAHFVITGLNGLGFGDDEISTDFVARCALLAATVPIMLLLPALIVAGVWCKRSGLPYGAALVRTVRRGALPTASVLLTCYVVSAVKTLQLEAQSMAELREMLHHEGRYVARLAGAALPGPTLETKAAQ